MSAKTANAVVETTGNNVERNMIKDKGASCKNRRRLSKNKTNGIVKEIIKDDIVPDEEEADDDKASRNLVVGKTIEVNQDCNVNNCVKDSESVLVNGSHSTIEKMVVENGDLSVNKVISDNRISLDSKVQSNDKCISDNSSKKDSLDVEGRKVIELNNSDEIRLSKMFGTNGSVIPSEIESNCTSKETDKRRTSFTEEVEECHLNKGNHCNLPSNDNNISEDTKLVDHQTNINSSSSVENKSSSEISSVEILESNAAETINKKVSSESKILDSIKKRELETSVNEELTVESRDGVGKIKKKRRSTRDSRGSKSKRKSKDKSENKLSKRKSTDESETVNNNNIEKRRKLENDDFKNENIVIDGIVDVSKTDEIHSENRSDLESKIDGKEPTEENVQNEDENIVVGQIDAPKDVEIKRVDNLSNHVENHDQITTNEDNNQSSNLEELKSVENLAESNEKQSNDRCEGSSCPLCNCDCRYKKNNEDNKSKNNIDLYTKVDVKRKHEIIIMESIFGKTIIDYLTNKSDLGVLRNDTHNLNEEHDRLLQLSLSLKKQLDDATCIIKQLIDQKIAQKSWTERVVPLKVTRSVGLQVCTTGSPHVLIKSQDYFRRNHSPNDVNINTTDSLANFISSDSNIVNILSRKNKDTSTVRNPSLTSHKPLTSANTKQLNVTKAGAEDDIEIQVIEPARSKNKIKKILPKITTDQRNQVNPILAAANIIASGEPVNIAIPVTTTSNTITSQVTPTILIMNTSDNNGTPTATTTTRNGRQVAKVSGGSEVIIDLTDNDNLGAPPWQVGKVNNSSTEVSSQLGVPSAISRLQAAQLKQSLNLNVPATNQSSSTNKVIAFPADSTTYVVRPNVPTVTTTSSPVVSKASLSNSVRKTNNTQLSPPSSGSDLLLSSMTALPPLPRAPKYPPNVLRPPKPILRICKNHSGIMLSWNFDSHIPTTIKKYQIYAYQEVSPTEGNKTEIWKKVGDVDALPLPMACTLTQFKEGHKYAFIVRAIDVALRVGEFSLPGSIMLTNSSPVSNGTTTNNVILK